MPVTRFHLAARTVLVLVLPAATVFASEHLVQMHKVVGGVTGDSEIQAIQFRMRAANQNQFQYSKV
ncbi:MAG: hypothetical protein IH986_17510, partial [Planctomycetes bacterium]|nr:hypothetical protein [Planctomycetota bacterium]